MLTHESSLQIKTIKKRTKGGTSLLSKLKWMSKAQFHQWQQIPKIKNRALYSLSLRLTLCIFDSRNYVKAIFQRPMDDKTSKKQTKYIDNSSACFVSFYWNSSYWLIKYVVVEFDPFVWFVFSSKNLHSLFDKFINLQG